MKSSHILLSLPAILLLSSCSGNTGRTGGPTSHLSSSAQLITDVIISTPLPNTVVSSPLTVKGKARGHWFFEASLPVLLIDENGNQIAIAPAQAKGEWMTTDFVDFETTLTFQTDTERGFLVMKKDNPSGLPENDAEVRMPVRFQ